MTNLKLKPKNLKIKFVIKYKFFKKYYKKKINKKKLN